MHYSTSRAFHPVVTWEQVLLPEIQDSLTRLPCHIAFSCLLHGLHCFQKGKWVHLFHQNLKSKIRKGGWSKQFVSFSALIKRTGCSQFHVCLKNSQKKAGDLSRILYYVRNVPRWGGIGQWSWPLISVWQPGQRGRSIRGRLVYGFDDRGVLVWYHASTKRQSSPKYPGRFRDPLSFLYSDTSANEDNSFRNHIR